MRRAHPRFLKITAALLALGVIWMGAALPARADQVSVTVEGSPPPGARVPVVVRTDRAGRVEFRAWRLERPEALLDAGVFSGAAPDLFWLDPRDQSATAEQLALRQGAGLVEVRERVQVAVPANEARAVDLPLREAGFYLVACKSGRLTAYATAVVSDLALLTKRHGDDVVVWAVRRTDGTPLEGTAVTLHAAGKTLASRETDADGLARFRADFPPVLGVRAARGPDRFFGTIEWYGGRDALRRVYMHTHQPAYRPGERVELRGIVRALQDGTHRLDPTATQATLRFLDPSGTAHGETEVAISRDMGTFASGYDLAEEALTGSWTIVAEVDGRAFAAPLEVAAYRKPTIEVDVTSPDLQVMAGDATRFAVHGTFFEGGDVANAQVQWTLLHHPMDRTLFPEDELVRLFFGTERAAYAPKTLSNGEGTLDAFGRLELELAAPADLKDGTLVLRASVVGPDRVAASGTGRIGVSTSPIHVGLETDRHLYGPEDVASVRIRVRDARGAPAVGREGVLTVGRSADARLRAREETWVHTITFRTDERGEAVVDAPLVGPGRYTLAVAVGRQAHEPEGPPAHASIDVWARGEQPTDPESGTLRLVADRDTYPEGAVAQLMVLSPQPNRPVLVTVEGESLLDVRVLRPEGHEVSWELPLEGGYIPNVFVTAATVDHGRMRAARRMLRIPPRSRLLQTTITPDNDTLEPGRTSGATIAVLDASGAPVEAAEVSVAVVDAALLAIHADPAAPIEAFFHPPQRDEVGTEALLHWRSAGRRMPLVVGYAADPSIAPATSAMPSESAGACGAASGVDNTPPPPARAPAPEHDAGPDAEEPEGALGLGGGGGGRARLRSESELFGDELQDMDFEEAKSKKDLPLLGAEVREDFRTAIYWSPALRTGPDGRVRAKGIRYADSLTRWLLSARAVDADTRVGVGTAEVTTRRNVVSRLTTPRFLTVGDRAQVPLVLRNLTDEDVAGRYDLSGTGLEDPRTDAAIELAAGATQVVEGWVEAGRPGTLALEAALRTPVGGDAEKRTVPVRPQGIRKVVGHTMFVENGTEELLVEVPAGAEPGTIVCRVSVEPAFVQALLGALPYLEGYPYGCTEQTMSRFLPLVSATEVLAAFDDVQGPPGTAELPKMVAAGLARLSELQHDDGGFGWWERDATHPAMTALVVGGLTRLVAARPEDTTARALLGPAAEALVGMLRGGAVADPTLRAQALHALAAAGRLEASMLPPPNAREVRDGSPLARAFLLRTAVALGAQDLAQVLRAVLEDEAHLIDGLASWLPSAPGGEGPTRWQDDDIEGTATVLLALLEAGGNDDLLHAGARWLLDARVGGDRWRSTRDTATAVTFLAAYTRHTGDLGVDRPVTVLVDGVERGRIVLTRETVFSGEAMIDIPGLEPGARARFGLVCESGTATAGIALRYHETGPAIARSSHGFDVTRRFYLLTPEKGPDGVRWTRTAITETVPSGAFVECEIEVATPEPRDYVMITSPHVAGFEPVREIGMDVPGRRPATDAQVDRRDDRTVFFLTGQETGTVVLRHLLRATHVGAYTALPAQAELMYFPDVRGNGDGAVWEVSASGEAASEAMGGGR